MGDRAGSPSRPAFPFALLLLACLLTPVSCLLARAADIAPNMLLLDGALASSAVVAVGERGTILRSADQAATWQLIPAPTTATLTGVSFAPDGQRGWAAGHDALILATTDGGHTWAKQFQGESLQDSFLDVVALDAQRALAIGAYGLFAITADGGKTWTRRKIVDDDYHLNRISLGPTGTLYIAGERGTLLRSTNNGARWSKIAARYEGSFYGILPLDRRTLLAYGLRGHVFRSVNDGDDWTPIAAPQPVLLAAAVQRPGNGILVAGHARAFLLSRDYGQSLAPIDTPLTTAVAELLALPNGSVLALGEAGATVLSAPK